MRYLTAIESDDFKHLPGGIFNRSFIRAYARYINYDEELAIADYAAMMREQSDSPDEVAVKPYKSLVYTETGTNPSHSPLWTVIWAILILIALSLSIWAGLHFYQRTFTPRKSPNGSNHRTSPDKVRAMRAGMSYFAPASGAENRAAKEGRNEFAE